MNSPFSKGTLYLKRRNQDLLAQLESNSAILQDRLAKLCKAPCASTAQSPEQLQITPRCSPLKRKHGYESWLMRNNSGQVSAALNPNIFWNSTPSPILDRNNVCAMPLYVDEATIMSPAKRPKRYGDQDREGNYTSAATPLISSRCPIKRSQPRRKCPECYCQASKQQSAPKKHGIKCAARVCNACSDYKIPDNSMATLDNSHSNLDSQRKTLEEARSVISYSPESVFLKGLKKRSKVNLDEPDTSSPEVDNSTIHVGRQSNIHGRENSSRQSAKGPSRGISNVTDKSKRSKPAVKSPSLTIGNATENPEHARPKVKSPSYGASNLSGKSGHSYRRRISESSSKSGRRKDLSSKESSQPIANSSVPCRSTSASTRKFTTNACSKKVSTLVSRISKPTYYDEPTSSKEFHRPTTSNAVPSTSTAAKYPGYSPTKNICRPALARLIPTPSYKTAMSPPLPSNRQPATRSTHHNPAPPNESTRRGSRSSKHGISPAKDQLKSDTLYGKSKTPKAKSRAASSRATSSKRDARISPTVSSSSSPSCSPAREDLQGHSDVSEFTCPVQTKENCRATMRKSKKTKSKLCPKKSDHRSGAPAKGVPLCCYTGAHLRTSPVPSSPCKKYKNIYKPYCKKYCRKESFTTTFETIDDKPLNDCYHNMVSPTVVHCKPYKRSHRKSTRNNRPCGNSCCCNNCYCGCRQHDPCPRLVDSEPAMRSSRSCARGGPAQDEWVDEMSRYRQSHWFDCHAYPTNRERPTSSRVNLESLHTHHNGAHRYILNDRLFPTPLPCTSNCVRCRQSGDGEIRPLRQRFPREITLNTVRNRDEVQVVLPKAPLSKHRADEPKAGPFKIYHDPEKKAKGIRKSTGCMLTHPIHSKPLLPKFRVPANSLALRYQKGIV